MKTITVLSGAGMSAESGIPTFRGLNGLWEGHDIREVASPRGWRKDPEMVLEFYNIRRRNMLAAQPNAGHQAIRRLEEKYRVHVVTQNIDNLHERAGSTDVLHLHGEIMKARSTAFPELVYELEPGKDIRLGDLCEKGAQLRPHIVWFEEDVPLFGNAISLVESADIVIVVGTSMVVYPANTLVTYARPGVPVFVVDPNKPEMLGGIKARYIEAPASEGMALLLDELMA